MNTRMHASGENCHCLTHMESPPLICVGRHSDSQVEEIACEGSSAHPSHTGGSSL